MLHTASEDNVLKYIQAGRAAELRSEHDAAVRAYERALGALGTTPLTTQHADVLRFIGSAYRELGETERSEHYYRYSLAVAEETGYIGGVAHALNWLAAIAVRRGEMTSAEEQFQTAARKAQEAGDKRLLSMIEQNLGVLATIRGDGDAALSRYRAALTGFRALNDLNMVASVLNNIGVLQRDLERWQEAEASFNDALQVARAAENSAVANAIELNIAELAAAQSRWTVAGRVSQRAGKFAHQHRNRPREAEALRLNAVVAREKGKLVDAERLLGEAKAICTETEDKLLEAQVHRDLGSVIYLQGRAVEAKAALSRARTLFLRIGAPVELAATDQLLASIA